MDSMCDACAAVRALSDSYNEKLTDKSPLSLKPALDNEEVVVVSNFVSNLHHRACSCCFLELKQYGALNNVVQGLLQTYIEQVKLLPARQWGSEERAVVTGGGDTSDVCPSEDGCLWTVDQLERLLHLVVKVLQPQFPPYLAFKHVLPSALRPTDDGGVGSGSEAGHQEPTAMPGGAAVYSLYCDVHDPEVSEFVLRNVYYFCENGGLQAATAAFRGKTPSTLPLVLAHALLASVSNLKVWLNYRTIVQLLVPLRSVILKYMCKFSDADLKSASSRSMSDFMWSSIKDPLDAPLTFDRDGLELAFKFFNSCTLTMRLAGIAQINNHVSIFNELCNGDNVVEAESMGLQLASWLVQNQMVEQLFGPNLHVEVVKQSHIVLGFLAVEGRLSNEHIDLIFQASQLKHCSKQVYDIMAPLIKNLEAEPVLHLYSLLQKMEPRDHTEQSLYLASVLIKFIWSNGGGSYSSVLDSAVKSLTSAAAAVSAAAPSAVTPAVPSQPPAGLRLESDGKTAVDEEEDGGGAVGDVSSSENSIGCVDGSDDEAELDDMARASSRIRSASGVTANSSIIAAGGALTGDIPSPVFTPTADHSPSVSGVRSAEDSPAVSGVRLAEDGLNPSTPDPQTQLTDDGADTADEAVVEGAAMNPARVDGLDDPSVPLSVRTTSAADIHLSLGRKRVMDCSYPDLSGRETTEESSECDEDAEDAAADPRLLLAASPGVAAAHHLHQQHQQHRHRRHRAAAVAAKRFRLAQPSPPPPGSAGDAAAAAALVVAAAVSPHRRLLAVQPVTGLGLVTVALPPAAQSPSISSPGSHLDAADSPLIIEPADKLKTSLLKNELQQFKLQQIRGLSDDEDSCSSRMSVKSEKNMADFLGEDSLLYEEELVQLALQAHHSQLPHHLASMASMYQTRFGAVPPTAAVAAAAGPSVKTRRGSSSGQQLFARFSADAVCRPGHTLLWDLLQDERVNEMSEGMAIECEKILSNLLCYNSDRLVRRKFIEGCLQKLAQGSSVLVVLRLLPKLFASFQQFRGLDTHQVTLWAEREHSMMQHFFNNLQQVSAAAGAALPPAAARRNASGSSADCSTQQLQPSGLRPVEVQVRLHFLSTVFCSLGSPDHFRLSVEQMDILWSCLAYDPRCSEDLFSWMLSQVRSKDQHALGMDSLRHLLTAKLPSLRPEEMGMTALNLYQQLYQLLRLAGAPLGDTEATGMDHLWKIALRANDTDVSLASIQYLNSCYVSGRADRERQFIERCMRELAAAGEELSVAAAAAGGDELLSAAAGGEEARLLPIQRGLLLLGKHLQTYKRRYAYQLRCWLLEGDGVVSHAQLVGDTSCSSSAAGGVQRLNILLQPAGLAEKRMVRLPANSYVAELRAEAHAFWRQLQLSRLAAAGGCVTEAHLPTTCANLRLISQGTELTPEFDEKTLADVGFKDMQLVFTSVGVPRPTRHLVDACGTMIVSDVAPARDSVPMLLLLQERHFSQLLQLMQKLSALRTQTGAPHTKAQVLSRRVWDILMALPTAPQLRDGFKNLTATSAAADAHVQPPSDSGEQLMRQLLDPSMPQKLMYSLYLVASLCANSRDKDDEGETESCSTDRVEWKHKFIESGGLKHLNQILMSGVLQCGDSTDHWDEWSQDCLACLLQVIAQLATVPPSTSNTSPPPPPASTTSPPPPSASPAHLRLTVDAPSGHRKRTRRALLSAGAASATRKQLDRYAVLKLSETALGMLDLEALAGRLCSVLHDASLPRDPNHYRTGFWGRAQVVHYALGLLVSLCYSSPDVAADAIYRCPQYPAWIRRLLLEDPEPAVRRETADGLHRLCLGHADESVVTSADSASTAVTHPFLVPILRELLEFLPVAEAMKMSPSSSTPGGVNEVSSSGAAFSSSSPATGTGYLTTTSTSTPSSSCDDPTSLCATTASSSAPSANAKDPYGPSCREFFALACRLLDGLGELAPSSDAAEELRLVELACRVGESVARRDYRERRHRSQPDEGLVGLLRLCTAIVRQAPAFKQHEYAQQFILQLFESLFALPTPRARQLPLCKSSDARSAGLDLLLQLVTGSEANYRRLLGPLGQLTGPQEGSPYPWDYWPHEDGRSDCGYVGLTNLGATCYMASCMQHLFMMPQARASILQASVDGSCQHETTLHELQRMFAYLLESERKAYSPRSFCKVYTMDHRPLNTGEQKDMAEFFIDLVSKLEDMTPPLKHLIKQLFCGQITNNVVSLDCGHVSRTCEEFYTVRCQVADMRSLYDSLDEVTVKDTLDGDNMYTCSQCQKKVRAEKRACFKRLPHILCFNTMRYTFNMNTMMREKVNTLFSFPLHLDMSGYLERNLMPTTNCDSSSTAGDGDATTERRRPDPDGELFEYALIGVTVHTGTADGGHYYSFIRDRTAAATARHSWLFFNDAEVRPFDPSQLAAECFGGEMTSKTYDSITDKFLDFSFEKTNSAYMLFYERCVTSADGSKRAESSMDESSAAETTTPSSSSATDSGDGPNRRSSACDQAATTCSSADLVETPPNLSPLEIPSLELNSELEQWIWKDNMEFLRDKNMFDHSFFSFMWQVCGYVPQTLPRSEEVTLVAARLSTTFFLEIFIHAKEKPTMVQWVELLTKQFNASQAACEWFLDHMAGDDWWPVQILIKCPNQMVRQMLQRLCIHVVQKLRPTHCCRYLVSSERYDRLSASPVVPNNDDESAATASLQHPPQQLGDASCVTRFVKKLISLMEHSGKSHQRNLTEYFAFLLEFARMGDVEVKFLLSTNCISTMVNFYLCQLAENGEELSDADDDDDMDTASVPGVGAAGGDTPSSHQHASHHRGGATSGGQHKFRPASFEKMVSLVALLVDKSRSVASVATIGGASVADDPRLLSLSPADLAAVAGGKGFPFLCHQIRDGLNVRASCSLLLALCRWNEPLATLLVAMLFQAIIKYPESCQSFFRLLSLLLENDPTATSSTHASVAASASASLSPSSAASSSAGLPCFTQMALPHVWQVAELCPQATLEWLAAQVPRNKMAHCWVIQHLDTWCEHYLLAHSQFRVRAAASYLLVSLVPSSQFRHLFTQRQRQPSDLTLPPDSLAILHQVYLYLLRLLKPARAFSDIQHHGNMKLVQYFQLLQYCVVSRAEKLMFSPYTSDLWTLFHPKLSEPSTATHHNKQALLMFWCTVCLDCPENVQLIVSNPHITKNIAFNYILADHDDEQVVLFNRSTLPAYYGLLRLCCSQSRAFTRQLAGHQNLQWAFKNITPYPAQYSAAIDELFKLMALFSLVHPDSGEQELRDIVAFKRQTIQMYLQVLDARCSWSTLISALKLLADTAPERLFAVYNGALPLLCEALGTLHAMYHEATACHVLVELTELVRLITEALRCCKTYRDNKEARQALVSCKDRQEMVRKLATLLNSFTPPDLRLACIDALKELVVLLPHDTLPVLTPLMLHSHAGLKELGDGVPLGPFFPRPPTSSSSPGSSTTQRRPSPMTSVSSATYIRPPRPLLQMAVPARLNLQANKCERDEYERALLEHFLPYHVLADLMCRVAINQDLMSEPLASLSALLGAEAVPLQLAHFPKLWIDVHHTKTMEKHIGRLLSCGYLTEYMERVLTIARPSLHNSVIHKFFSLFLNKVPSAVRPGGPVQSQLAQLGEQICCDLSELCLTATGATSCSLSTSSSSTAEPVLVVRLTADLRALSLVYHAAPPSQPPSAVIRALQTAAARVTAANITDTESANVGTTSSSSGSVVEAAEDRPTSSRPPEDEKQSSDGRVDEVADLNSCPSEDSVPSSSARPAEDGECDQDQRHPAGRDVEETPSSKGGRVSVMELCSDPPSRPSAPQHAHPHPPLHSDWRVPLGRLLHQLVELLVPSKASEQR